MKTWNISDMNIREEVKYLARKEIKENNGKKGYWKQSLVCKISYYHGLCLRLAWELFNNLMLETVETDMNVFNRMYDAEIYGVSN